MKGRRVVFLVADLTYDDELFFPYYWLKWEGAETEISGLSETHISRFGREIKTDLLVNQLKPENYDAVIIPGGFGPDKLRTNKFVLRFVKSMFEMRKLVAAICHGPQVLISAGIIKNKTLTCLDRIAVDVVNAGGKYVNKEVVRDGNLITSRNPYDLPAFTTAIIEFFIREKEP